MGETERRDETINEREIKRKRKGKGQDVNLGSNASADANNAPDLQENKLRDRSAIDESRTSGHLVSSRSRGRVD